SRLQAGVARSGRSSRHNSPAQPPAKLQSPPTIKSVQNQIRVKPSSHTESAPAHHDPDHLFRARFVYLVAKAPEQPVPDSGFDMKMEWLARSPSLFRQLTGERQAPDTRLPFQI